MNNRQKNTVWAAVILLIVTAAIWVFGQREVFTKSSVWIDKTTEVDRMLGVEVGEWEDRFVFGLLPGGVSLTAESIAVSTVGGIIIVIAGVLFFIFKSKRIKEET